ncbi:hypothetical protein COX84_02730, partial [Candidatus Micrarchaeota archaeon CG_4_10_14_0_2_um_filter_49_7]
MGNLALQIARERIAILLELCEKNKDDAELCRYYARLAWKLMLRYNVKMQKALKPRLCKHCFAYFIPGRNVKVRLDSGGKRMRYECKCGKITYVKYGKKKGE